MDYAAATPLRPEVLAAMMPFFEKEFGNPSSLYTSARRAKASLEQARSKVADALGAKAPEVIFTSGSTESVNLAIQGVARSFPGGHIIISTIEHEAVMATAAALERDGWQITRVPVKASGIIDPDLVAAAIRPNTILVSLMYANNEIGTIQPIAKIGALIKLARQNRTTDLPLYFHTDATAAAVYLDLHVNRLGVDLLSFNGSKIYGPKHTGVLYIKAETRLTPLMYGGGQQRGLRSGSEDVAGAVGIAKALELVVQTKSDESRRLRKISDDFWRSVCNVLPQAKLNGDQKHRLPNNINFSISNVDGEALVMLLDKAGFAVSTGSACSTGRLDPSHVLKGIGLDDNLCSGSLRLTFGIHTSKEDLDHLLRVLPIAVNELLALGDS